MPSSTGSSSTSRLRSPQRRHDGPPFQEKPMSHNLIVLPDDTAKPLVDAVNGTKLKLQIRMFLFTDTTLLDAVIAAHRRGVQVRVMLNPARRSGEAENEESRKALTAAGVAVRDSNPAFDVTHQKSMVVDE